jgi:hypothetical protein
MRGRFSLGSISFPRRVRGFAVTNLETTALDCVAIRENRAAISRRTQALGRDIDKRGS